MKNEQAVRLPARIEKPIRPKRKCHFENISHTDAFQSQLDAYQYQLVTELNHDLATADNKLATSIDDLGHRFVGKFNLIEDSGNIVNTKLASERLEIDEGAEQIVFGPYVENFKQICREKGAKLSGLWAQYVDVQKEIMELAVTICDDEEVLIGYTQNEGEDVLGMEEEKKNERDNPGIDETRASKQRDIFLSGYDHASRELDELKERVDNMTEQTLKKNADILQDFDESRKTITRQISDVLKQAIEV